MFGKQQGIVGVVPAAAPRKPPHKRGRTAGGMRAGHAVRFDSATRRRTKARRLASMLLVAPLVAEGAFCAGASAASKTLDLTWEGVAQQLKPHQEVQLVNTSDITFTAAEGTITCSSEDGNQRMVGADVSNEQKTDEISLDYATGPIEVRGGGYCSSDLPLFDHRATVEFEVGAATLILGANGKVKLESSQLDTMEVRSEDGYVCTYGFKRLRGTMTLYAHENHDLFEVSFVKQKFKLTAKQSACPKQLAMTAPFQYTLIEPEQFYVFAQIL